MSCESVLRGASCSVRPLWVLTWSQQYLSSGFYVTKSRCALQFLNIYLQQRWVFTYAQLKRRARNLLLVHLTVGRLQANIWARLPPACFCVLWKPRYVFICQISRIFDRAGSQQADQDTAEAASSYRPGFLCSVISGSQKLGCQSDQSGLFFLMEP